MKVFVTGGTGFVGGEILRRLIAAGHEVRALVRVNTEKGTAHLPEQVVVLRGNVLAEDLYRDMLGMDAVIHLVGIIREFPSRGVTFRQMHIAATRNVVAAMERAKVRRLVHMSALGAAPDGPTDYFRTKWEAETAVRQSELAWTVMKPSVIYGPTDEFVNMLAGQVRIMPVVPVIGDGKYLLQPVSVGDVAKGFVDALTRDETVGKVYEVGGPEKLAYNQILDRIGAAVGRKRVWKVHVPLGLMKQMIRAMERFSFFPITTGQLEMLLMNNVTDAGEYWSDFGLEAVDFQEGIKAYIK